MYRFIVRWKYFFSDSCLCIFVYDHRCTLLTLGAIVLTSCCGYRLTSCEASFSSAPADSPAPGSAASCCWDSNLRAEKPTCFFGGTIDWLYLKSSDPISSSLRPSWSGASSWMERAASTQATILSLSVSSSTPMSCSSRSSISLIESHSSKPLSTSAPP
jgi:hypothetical protein